MKRQLCGICILITCTLSLPISAQICNPGQFRDSESGVCKSCMNLCQFGTNQRTVSECREHCPDYARNSSCPDGSYYDVNLSKCDECSSICDQHKIRGTSSDCKQHCPKEYAQSMAPTIKCASGSYYNSTLSRCDACSLLCDQHIKMGSTEECKKYCPKEFEESIGKEEQVESKTSNNIVIIIGVLVGAIIITASVGLFTVIKHFCSPTHRGSAAFVEIPNHTEIPHAKYAYIDHRIHTQCVDSCTISHSSSEGFQTGDEDDTSIVRKEERKFPMAHADLPYSARRDSNLHV